MSIRSDMVLTGQAKADYQREYMRKRRSNARSSKTVESVRPKAPALVRPEGISDNQWEYMKYKAGV